MADQQERRPRKRRPKKKLTPAQQALADASRKREQEARTRTNAESVKKAKAASAQPELKSSTVDMYEQMARDRGYTNAEDIKRAAAKYREDAAKKRGEGSKEQIAGLSMLGAMDRITANAQALAGQRRSLANPGLYGGGVVRDSDIKARLTAQKNAVDEVRRARLRKEGSAVYMGAKDAPIRRPIKGDGEFEGGQFRVPQSVPTDNVVDKNQLLAWLADEGRFTDIKSRMLKAGLDVQTYEDVAKLWESVVKQASATYSLTGKKVTPWALLELRGKQMVNGRPAARTTTQTSTDIEAMDPATARLMVERTMQDHLGRTATKAEVDDFISKAQLIAKENPRVSKTTTTTQYGFDGQPVSSDSQSTSSGGGQAVSDQAAIAAEDAAKESPDYRKFQAGGVYGQWLFDALESPV